MRTIPGLVVASLFLEMFTMIWSPAKEATVPSVVPAEKLTTANSLSLVAAYATMPVAGPDPVLAQDRLNDHLAEVGFLGFLGLNRNLGDTQTLAFYFDALSFACLRSSCGASCSAGMPATGSSARRTGEVPIVVDDVTGEVVQVEGAEEEKDDRSTIKRTFDEIREGWTFIYSNPVVRAVILGLATGLVGGAMLVPLGPTFARFVIGDQNTFPLFITALGFGVASGVVLLSVVQNRIPAEPAFPVLVVGAGVSMFLGVSMSNFWFAALGVYGLGLFAGAVYVLGFTLLQKHTDEELRGRIFATMLTLVRMCVLLALVLGPVLATVFNGFASAATGAEGKEVPTVSVFGFDLAIPGVRLTLWLAALMVIGAGFLSGRSMRAGLRTGIREGLRGAISEGNGQASSRASHPTAQADDAEETIDAGGPGAAANPVRPPPVPVGPVPPVAPVAPVAPVGPVGHADAGANGDDPGPTDPVPNDSVPTDPVPNEGAVLDGTDESPADQADRT